MNAHTPFDAKQDWTNPYCQNSSNDPMVDALLGNAYHVVRTVYCNLGNLKLIYDFLNQYGMVLGVQSEAELKALTTKAKYARIYGFSRAGDRQVTDYLYVDGDRTGIIPDDPKATGSWITVATSGSNGGGTSSGEGAYIPWVYSNGSATGGETTINVPDGTVGVPFIIVNGDMQYVGRGFEFDAENLSVTLAQPLEEGDEVVFLLTGVPAVPDNPHVNDWVQINWLYNNGAAVGGEQVIVIPYTFQSIPAVYKNGLRLTKNLATNSYLIDTDNQSIILTEPLTTNDRVIIQIGGEARVMEVSDRTVQEIARSLNVSDSAVILSTNTASTLNGKKFLYSVEQQKVYELPILPSNIYISAVSGQTLIYNPGEVQVILKEVVTGNVLQSRMEAPNGAILYPELQIARWRDEGDVRGWGAVGDGEANDTISLEDAAEERMPNLWRGIYKVDSVSLSHGAYSSGATILLSGRTNNITKPIFSGPLVGNLTLQGEPPVTLNILSANISSASTFSVEYYAGDFRQAKYQFVDILLSGPVQVGNMLLVRANKPELSGCFEVVGVPAANTARVLMLAQGTLDVSNFTGTTKVLTTVLQFSNITPIDVSGGSLTLENIGILGPCYPVENESRSNVYDPSGGTGVSGIVARNGGIVIGVNSGVSGISGTQLVGVDSGEIDWTGSFVSCGGRNGISASFGKLTFASGVATQNLLDNVITQDQSFGFATSSISAHAGRNGYISSTNSTCNLSGSKSQQNGFMDPTNGNGASASSGNLTVIGCQIKNNANAGIIGIGSSDIRGTGINVQWNSYGVLMDTASHALVTGIVNNNSVTDLLARNRGKIEAINVTHTTSKPQVNLTDGTGALVQNTSGINDFRTSGGLEVAGGGVIKKVIRMRVTGVDFPSVPAGSQQSVSVTVPGVIVADNSVVMVQRDSTTDRAGLMYEAVVSSDNTVLITCNNFSTSPIDPPPENFNILVFSFS